MNHEMIAISLLCFFFFKHIEKQNKCKGRKCKPEAFKMQPDFYLVAKESSYSSTTHDGPWIIHPAKVRLIVDLSAEKHRGSG